MDGLDEIIIKLILLVFVILPIWCILANTYKNGVKNRRMVHPKVKYMSDYKKRKRK